MCFLEHHIQVLPALLLFFRLQLVDVIKLKKEVFFMRLEAGFM